MTPVYDKTPVAPEDAMAFVEGVSFATKQDVYQAEAEGILSIESQMMDAIADGRIAALDLCDYQTLFDLHRACYSAVWAWAGKVRDREVSIGVPPELIRQRLPEELGTIAYWVENGKDPFWTAMAAHHRLVMIHPFVDGNDRVTRLFADLLLFSLTSQYTFDWGPAIGSPEYFGALREADRTMSPDALLEIVGLVDLSAE